MTLGSGICSGPAPSNLFGRHFAFDAPNSPDISAEIANGCDGWIEGVKASETGSRHDLGARLEKRGSPGVSIRTECP